MSACKLAETQQDGMNESYAKEFARRGGSTITEKKSAAARENGRLGGRPKRKNRIASRKYRHKNLEMVRKKAREKAKLRKAEHRIQSALFRKRHPEKVKSLHRNWRAKNPNWDKNYYARNAEKLRAQKRDWNRRNPDKCARIAHNTRIKRKAYPRTPDASAAISKIRKLSMVKCFYCGKKMPGNRASVDHVTPLSKGGMHSAFNLVPSCLSCNHRKSAKNVNDFISRGQLILL